MFYIFSKLSSFFFFLIYGFLFLFFNKLHIKVKTNCDNIQENVKTLKKRKKNALLVHTFTYVNVCITTLLIHTYT